MMLACASPSARSQVATAVSTGPDLEEVVVTAQKRTEKLSDVPVSMAVMTEDQLESRDINSLSDLTGYVAGLEVSNSGSPGQNGIVIRGLSTGYNNSFSAPLVATYIDDEPIGSSSTGARAGLFSLDLMPYDIEHVEVLRGPQGTLYGADAMGGIIKYTLRKPDLQNFDVRVGASSEHADGSGGLGSGWRAAVNAPIVSDRLGVRVSGYYQNNAGYLDNIGIGRKDSNESKQYGGRATLLWRVNDNLSVQATALFQDIHSYDNTAVTFDEATGLPLYGDDKRFSYFPEPFRQQTRDFSLHIDWDLHFATLSSSSSYSRLESSMVEDFSSASPLYIPAYPDALSTYGVADYVSKYTEETRLTSPNSGRAQWLVGGFFTEEHPGETDNWPTYFPSGAPLPGMYANLLYGTAPSAPNYREWALFGTGTLKITNRFDISAGPRYAQNSQSGCIHTYGGLYGTNIQACYDRPAQDVWTWMTDSRFHLDQDSMIYARVATGYRPGFGCTTCGIPALKVPGIFYPDRLTNYEVGLKSDVLSHRLQLNASAFYIDWRDIQIQVVNSQGFGYTGNGGTALSEGFEYSASYALTGGLRLGANAAYTDAHLTENAPGVGGESGDPLPESPKWSASATADYARPLSNATSFLLGAAYRYRSMVYNQFRSSPYPYPMKAENIVDLYAGLQMRQVLVRLYAKNAFNDRAYTGLEYAVDPSRPDFVPIQPQTIGISVDYDY